jgi:hypothetical protein
MCRSAVVARARLLAGALAALTVMGAAGDAFADDPDVLEQRTASMIFVSGALELIPFAIGGTMVANSGDVTVRRASVYVSSLGFTLAPLVAHGMMGEWVRGVPFASVPFACGVALAVLMQQPNGDVLSELGNPGSRVPFWALASTALAASTFGVVDAAFAPNRSRARAGAHAFYVVPSRVPSGVALNFGGAF